MHIEIIKTETKDKLRRIHQETGINPNALTNLIVDSVVESFDTNELKKILILSFKKTAKKWHRKFL